MTPAAPALPPPDWENAKYGVRLWCGDCADFVQPADAIITDPPWGINGGSGTISKARGKGNYADFEDTPDNVRTTIIPRFADFLSIAKRGAITCGVPMMFDYPHPTDVGGFFQPASMGRGKWGFSCFNPVLFYGKDPQDGKAQNGSMRQLTDRPSDSRHPCAKPLSSMLWLIKKVSCCGEIVCDPFMGIGTTGVAAIKLGRRFVGIEIHRSYFDIAVDRISKAIDEIESDMFGPDCRKPDREQTELEIGL